MDIMTTIQYAEEWFKLHDIPTTIDDGSIYVKVGIGGDYEVQLSTAEVEYRAELYKSIQLPVPQEDIVDKIGPVILEQLRDIVENECEKLGLAEDIYDEAVNQIIRAIIKSL